VSATDATTGGRADGRREADFADAAARDDQLRDLATDRGVRLFTDRPGGPIIAIRIWSIPARHDRIVQQVRRAIDARW
jgi:hypothetical protein